MPIEEMSAGAGGLGGMALMGGVGALGSIFNNERNLAYQQNTQDYMKWAQQMSWQREDNAVQRRVADLKAAGLSPVLAAGSAASTMSPMRIDPLHSDDAAGTSGAVSAMELHNRIAQTQANVETAQAQRDLLKSSEALNYKKGNVLDQELRLYGRDGGHPKYQDVWGKRLSALVDALGIKGITPAQRKAATQKMSEAEKSVYGDKTPAWRIMNEQANSP